MPRPPGPTAMRRQLDRVIFAQLKVGKVRRYVGGEVIETDLPAAFLDLVRKRVNDCGAAQPDQPDATKLAIAELARKAAERGDLGPLPDESQPARTTDTSATEYDGHDDNGW